MTGHETTAVETLVHAAEEAEAVLNTWETSTPEQRMQAIERISNAVHIVRKVASLEARPCANCGALGSCCDAAKARLEDASALRRLVEKMQGRNPS